MPCGGPARHSLSGSFFFCVRRNGAVNQVGVAVGAGHFGVLEHCVRGLSSRAGRLDGRERVATQTGSVILGPHGIAHILLQFGAPGVPYLRIVEVLRHHRDHVVDARRNVDPCLDEPIGLRDVTVPAAWTNAGMVAHVRRAQIVRVGCHARHHVTASAEFLGRGMLIDFDRSDNRPGAGKTTDDKSRNDELPFADLQRFLPVIDRAAPVQQISSLGYAS